MLGRLRPNNLSEQGQAPPNSSACAWSSIAKLCLTLCNPMDCSPPGSFVHGLSRQEYWSGLPFPPPGNLPSPGTEPESSASSALQGSNLSFLHCRKMLFTTWATKEAPTTCKQAPAPPAQEPAQTCRPARKTAKIPSHNASQILPGSRWALPCPLAGQCNLLDTLGQYPTVSGNGHPPHQWS